MCWFRDRAQDSVLFHVGDAAEGLAHHLLRSMPHETSNSLIKRVCVSHSRIQAHMLNF